MSIDLEMEEIHKVFFEESFEGLDVMESSLLNLTANAGRETLDAIFRAAHSIKGGAATFGFMEVSGFTHGVETLLDEIRNGRRAISPQDVQLLLQSVDCIRAMIAAVQAKTPIDAQRVAALNNELAQLLARPESPAPSAAQPTAHPSAPSAVAVPAPAIPGGAPAGWEIEFTPQPDMLRNRNEPTRMFAELKRLGALDVQVCIDDVPALGELDAEKCYLRWHLKLAGAVGKSQLDEVFDWVEADCHVVCRPIGAADPEPAAATESPAAAVEDGVPPAPARHSPAAAATGTTASAAKASGEGGSIRVATEKVDAIINLVGELVITQSMLSRFGERFEIGQLDALREGLAQLTRNTRELQESVMQIRMLPIGFSFSRFPRLVHDLSAKLGKKVELRLAGEATELDKTVLEKIGDPLVHLVRNALDHGLETPEVRMAAGKPETGALELSAFHEGGSIVIEVRDDGAGINKAKILKKARERGLVSAEQELTEEQIHNLIFAAGFSTADAISDVSGRGVGMDVVRRNINDLGGQVNITSVEGRGSTIRIRLPLTLAILDGQLVRVGAETYVISLVAIIETIQVKREMLSSVAGRAELFRLRDEYLPVVRLCDQFGIQPDSRNTEGGLLVVVESDRRRVGILVDDLLAQQQVVIKSLETNFRQIPGLAGATILGDGTVALIIDVPGLIQNFLTAERAKPLAAVA